jgi:DNA-binding response OmpR family regulator
MLSFARRCIVLKTQSIAQSRRHVARKEFRQRVIVIGDDRGLNSMLRYALDSYGLEVKFCDNGYEVLYGSSIGDFDVVVTDYDIPGINGLELARRLREHFPKAFIIGMSGADRGVDFLRAGANDFLRKPFVPYRLAMMIDGGDILA